MVNGLHGGNLANAPRLVEEDHRYGKEPVVTRRLPAAANIAPGYLDSPMSVMRKDVQVNIFLSHKNYQHIVEKLHFECFLDKTSVGFSYISI